MAWPQMKSSEAISAPPPRPPPKKKKITHKKLVISFVSSLT